MGKMIKKLDKNYCIACGSRSYGCGHSTMQELRVLYMGAESDLLDYIEFAMRELYEFELNTECIDIFLYMMHDKEMLFDEFVLDFRHVIDTCIQYQDDVTNWQYV